MNDVNLLKPEIKNWKNLKRNLDYDIILVTVEDNLVHTKSGSKVSRNIADFMPDYNLWYAIKFCDVKEIWIVENNNYSLKYMSLTA